MAFDTRHRKWAGRDSAQSLLAGIVNETREEADHEKARYAAELKIREEERERERQRQIERERQQARLRISIEEERFAARERRCKRMKHEIEVRERTKSGVYSLPRPSGTKRKRPPKPLSQRLPVPKKLEDRGNSGVIPAPPGRAHVDEQNDEGYEIIAAIPIPQDGPPKKRPPAPPPAVRKSQPMAGRAHVPAERKSRVAEDDLEVSYEPPSRKTEAVLASVALAFSMLAVAFYVDAVSYKPDESVYYKVEYEPRQDRDHQISVGFIPVEKKKPQRTSRPKLETETQLTMASLDAKPGEPGKHDGLPVEAAASQGEKSAAEPTMKDSAIMELDDDVFDPFDGQL